MDKAVMSCSVARVFAGICALLSLGLLTFSFCADVFLHAESFSRSCGTFGGALMAGIAFGVLLKSPSCVLSSPMSMSWLAAIWNLALLLLIIGSFGALLASVTLSRGKGTPMRIEPFLQQSPPYRLNNHGTITVVGRREFLIKAISGSVAWHLAFISVACGVLFVTVFNRPPWPFSLLPPASLVENEDTLS